MKLSPHDMAQTCAVMFDRWCAEELVDPRLRDILEEAFVNGFICRGVLEEAQEPTEASA